MIGHPAPGVPYDELPREQQALVREWWDQAITRRREALDLVELFERSGQAYVAIEGPESAGSPARLVRRGRR